MRTRPEEFKCRVKKFNSEEIAERCLWAARQRNPALSSLKVKYCRVCDAWHWVRK